MKKHHKIEERIAEIVTMRRQPTGAYPGESVLRDQTKLRAEIHFKTVLTGLAEVASSERLAVEARRGATIALCQNLSECRRLGLEDLFRPVTKKRLKELCKQLGIDQRSFTVETRM